MTTHSQINELALKVAQRHDAFLRRRVILTTLLATATLTALAALFWVTRGHAVPWPLPAATCGIALPAAIAWYLLKRMDAGRAVLEADRFFELKDGLVTARHLAIAAPQAESTQLQWNWLSPRLEDCDPRRIRQAFPRRTASAAALLAIAASVLCLLPPSDAVLAAQQQAEETRQRVAEAKEVLEELIDELEKELDEQETAEKPDMDEFRKMVRRIEETGDRVEAARQFARIERKVRDAARALDQKRDEQTLKLAAKELKKSEDTEARKLGKKLSDKELREAAKMLEKLAAKKIDPKQLAKHSPDRKKAIEEALKNLAKMRATTKRLAAAGKQRQAARQAEGRENEQAANGKQGEQKLEDMLAELDQAAAEMEENLEEMEFDPNAEWNEECEACENGMKGMKGKLGQRLRKMHGKRMAQAKLDALREALAQAQGQCQGNGKASGASKGGEKPGVGSSWAERKERDDSQKNGSLAELKGQHGDGPSLSKIEDAESGTAVSALRGSNKQREFNRQIESFVQRDDIPESLKLGVRNYLEGLQTPPSQ